MESLSRVPLTCHRTAVLIELPDGMSPDSWLMVIDIGETFYLKLDAGLLRISPADETPVDADFQSLHPTTS